MIFSEFCSKVIPKTGRINNMSSAVTRPSFVEWAQAVLPWIRGLSPDTAVRYGGARQLEHYFRTAEVLERQSYSSIALAQAGFLHGVRNISLLSAPEGGVDPLAIEILEDRRRLTAIDKLDKEVPQHLTATLLPALRHATAAVLLVVEQLLHLDALRQFEEFARQFPRSPHLPPAKLVMTPTAYEDLQAQLAYLHFVVVPTAEFFGLWFYRNVAEDLGLYYQDQERFFSVVDFAIRQAESGELERRAEVIRKALHRIDGVEVFWEWHHVASLDRLLGRTSEEERWAQRLADCGMVTVVCPCAPDCYRIMAELHLSPAFHHQDREIDDTLGSPKVSGYEAVHTVVTPTRPEPSKAIRLRITFRKAHEQRFLPPGRESLALMQQLIDERRRKDRHLQVFANDGRRVLLRTGSTVLNFACAIHSHFVALARRARVNKEPVDLLHPLKEGDVVHVEIGTEPVLLPAGWEEKVPPDTVSRIQRAHKECYKPALVKAGRMVLRERLHQLGVHSILNEDVWNDAMLESSVEDALAALATGEGMRPAVNVSWVLRQLNTSTSHLSESDSRLLEMTIQKTAELAAKREKTPIEGLSFPKAMLGSFDRQSLCSRCSPSPDIPVNGKLEGQTLVIHDSRAECGAAGTPIQWKRQYTRGQHFVIEMINRQGIAAELISAVAKRGVDIVDHSGMSLGPSWAVLRLHVQSIGSDVVNAVAGDLQSIEGVIRVIKPGERVAPVLEGRLPPRAHDDISFSHVPPYLTGPVLTDDRFFYGRQDELGRLRLLLEQARSGSGRGLMALIQGPFKVGKSSLMKRFEREVSRQEYGCSIVELVAKPGETWCVFVARLRRELEEELKPRIEQKNPASEGLSNLPLDRLLNLFRDAGRCLVLIIDEAASLFVSSSGSDDMRGLLTFLSQVPSISGLLLIWTSLEAPLSDIAPELLYSLRSALTITLSDLEVLDVKRLLRAEKFGSSAVRIMIEDPVGELVHQYTGGNPYWCTALASELFRMQHIKAESIRYSRGDFRKAKDWLKQSCALFDDRVENFIDSEDLGGLIPVLLSELAAGKEAGLARLSSKQLLKVALRSHINVSAEELDWVLKRLKARGTIVNRYYEGSETWSIAAPALADHIRFCPKTRPNHNGIRRSCKTKKS